MGDWSGNVPFFCFFFFFFFFSSNYWEHQPQFVFLSVLVVQEPELCELRSGFWTLQRIRDGVYKYHSSAWASSFFPFFITGMHSKPLLVQVGKKSPYIFNLRFCSAHFFFGTPDIFLLTSYQHFSGLLKHFGNPPKCFGSLLKHFGLHCDNLACLQKEFTLPTYSLAMHNFCKSPKYLLPHAQI